MDWQWTTIICVCLALLMLDQVVVNICRAFGRTPLKRQLRQ